MKCPKCNWESSKVLDMYDEDINIIVLSEEGEDLEYIMKEIYMRRGEIEDGGCDC